MNKSKKKPAYLIETYGCQMNKAESDSIELSLKKAGWEAAESSSEADLVILHTCAVRQTAENRIWGRIGEYTALKKEKSFTLAVIGCMAERIKKEFKRKAPAVDLVLGNTEKQHILSFVSRKKNIQDSEYTVYDFPEHYQRKNAFQVLLPIMHGCNNYCSYCIVPYVRGPEVSRPYEEISEEIIKMKNSGVKEITLLGQNVNSYHFQYEGRTIAFPQLLQRISEIAGPNIWIRFLTSHPKDFSPELIEVMAAYSQICRHIHLPVQHGSDRILQLMNRGYGREHYFNLVSSLRRRIPETAVSTDILIGFPTETEEDFQDTISLMKTVQFNDAFTYKYNSREGTKAASMDGAVAEDIMSTRLEEIIAIQRKISQNIRKTRIGEKETVLVEQISKKSETEVLARNEFNEMVVFPGDRTLVGTFQTVMINGLAGTTLKGEKVK